MYRPHWAEDKVMLLRPRVDLTTSRSPRPTRDRGAALVELLVSIVILGTLGVAVIGAAATSASSAATNRDIAETQAALSSTGDALMDVTDPDASPLGSPDKIVTYVSCVDQPDNAALVDLYQQQVDQITVDFPHSLDVTVAEVSYWNGTSFADTCRFNEGHRLQEVVLRAQGRSALVRELRVLRRPFSAIQAAGAPAVSGPTDASGDLIIEPTPGLDGPETTTSTTTAAPTTTTTPTTSSTSTTSTSTTSTTSTTSSTTSTTTTTLAPPPAPEDPLVCAAVMTSTWNKTTEVGVTLTNSTTAAMNGWKAFIPLPAGSTKVTDWNNTVTYVAGGFEATNKYDVSIPPGGSVGFNFHFSHAQGASQGFDFTCDGIVETSATPNAAIACSVTARNQSGTTGLDGAVTNSSSDRVTGWTVFIPLPAGAVVTGSTSSATKGVAGGVEVSSLNFNKKLDPGDSTTFGLEFSPAAPDGFEFSCESVS